MKNKNDYYDNLILRLKITNLLKYIFLTLYALITIYPLIWIIQTSLKKSAEVYSNPFGLPNTWKFENYIDAFIGGNFLRSFANSFLYSITATLIVIFLSFMTAYALARIYKKYILVVYFTLGIMVPIHSVIIPLFVLMKNLGLHNSRVGIILIYVVLRLSFSIFILIPFIRKIPVEIEEAATIDGASIPRIAFQIVGPSVRAALTTVGTFAFLFSWNDLLVALIMAPNPKISTINLAAYNLRAMYVSDFGLVSAGITWLTIPVLIMYFIFQEQFIKGLTAGAVKG